MAVKPKRIILDTNLWISFLITKDFAKIDYLFIEKKFTLLFSEELLNEFIEVTQRPKFRKFFKRQDIQRLLNILDSYAEFISVTSNIEQCRDSKDNFLLGLAIDGKAHYLLTGDKDLLILKQIKSTRIITLPDFLHKID